MITIRCRGVVMRFSSLMWWWSAGEVNASNAVALRFYL
jgi:hypothetical protein